MHSRDSEARAVLHFTPFGGQLSGAQRSMLTLAVAQKARGDRPQMLLLREGAVADLSRSEKLPVHFCGIPENPGDIRLRHRLRFTYRLLKLRRRNPNGILHCHSAHGLKFLWPSAVQAGWRLLCHQRDAYRPNEFHEGLERVPRIVAISSWAREQLPRELQARASVIHNAQALPAERRDFDQLRSARPRIGFAGRCVPSKGVDLFLEAALEVMKRHDCEAHLWGLSRQGDSDQTRYSATIEKRVAALPETLRTRFTLEEFRNDIRAFYKAMDIVVIPSREPEAFGRVAIEAMSHGCVVIGSAIGGLCEIVREGVDGFLFESGQLEPLVDRIETVLQDPALQRRIGVAAIQAVADRFSPATHADAMEQVYLDLLRRPLGLSVLEGFFR